MSISPKRKAHCPRKKSPSPNKSKACHFYQNEVKKKKRNFTFKNPCTKDHFSQLIQKKRQLNLPRQKVHFSLKKKKKPTPKEKPFHFTQNSKRFILAKRTFKCLSPKRKVHITQSISPSDLQEISIISHQEKRPAHLTQKKSLFFPQISLPTSEENLITQNKSQSQVHTLKKKCSSHSNEKSPSPTKKWSTYPFIPKRSPPSKQKFPSHPKD